MIPFYSASACLALLQRQQPLWWQTLQLLRLSSRRMKGCFLHVRTTGQKLSETKGCIPTRDRTTALSYQVKVPPRPKRCIYFYTEIVVYILYQCNRPETWRLDNLNGSDIIESRVWFILIHRILYVTLISLQECRPAQQWCTPPSQFHNPGEIDTIASPRGSHCNRLLRL